ncbi:MAG: hypothetical protein ACOYL3_07990 [Desulfuromonadaceae bacterium]
MKLELPMPEWFTVEMLAKRWGTTDKDIRQYMSTGQLDYNEKITGGILSALFTMPTQQIHKNTVEEWEKIYIKPAQAVNDVTTTDNGGEILTVDPVTDYLESHKNAPDGEKGAWLQNNTKMTLNQIADTLNIPGKELDYNGHKSKSRKNTMGKTIRDWKDLQCKNIESEV